jgi:DNA-binding MarR family transcriptional regulator
MQTVKFEFHRLLHSADLIESQLRRRLTPLGLRPRQARIIDAVYRLGPITQNDLARAFDITPASMSTMTSRLVTAGFMSRRTNPQEMRCNLLQLTNSGHEQLQEIHRVWREMDQFIKDLIGTEYAATLSKTTQQLLDKLGGEPPEDRVKRYGRSAAKRKK